MGTVGLLGSDVPPSPTVSSPVTPTFGPSRGPVLMGPNLFRDLVCDLTEMLGPYSGLDSEEIEHEELMQLMREYKSNPADWHRYAIGDYSRGYTRNLVDKGNGKSNLLILVWSPGKGSPIHDHADAHCIMKILKGTLRETVYHSVPEGDKPPQIKGVTTYKENEVTYISDKIGIHKVENPDPENVAVSLHLYTPPHAATRGCNIFDAKTGKRSHVTQCEFYSIYGRKQN